MPPSAIDKVRFLSRPEHYPEHTRSVTIIETHHAWVFLTDDHAYKMKKPSRYGRLDMSSLEKRLFLCSEEIRLNQRLASQTYIGLVALVAGPDETLAIGGHGRIVDWLVKMRRLPGESLLNRAAERGLVGREDIDQLMRKLLRFYDEAPLCKAGGTDYTVRLRQEIAQVAKELRRPGFRFPGELVTGIVDRLESYLETNRDLLEQRQAGGKVRDVHGDLRPEHICFIPGSEPEIIDRVEFDADLRCLDIVEELAYLGLECRVITQPWLEKEVIRSYRAGSPDEAPGHLWDFYAARRAITRGMLCAWHTLDGGAEDHWLSRGRDYLDFAAGYVHAATRDDNR